MARQYLPLILADKGHRQSDKGGMNRSLSQLNLTVTQQAQVEAIKKSTSGNRMQKQQAVMAILTTEQR